MIQLELAIIIATHVSEISSSLADVFMLYFIIVKIVECNINFKLCDDLLHVPITKYTS